LISGVGVEQLKMKEGELFRKVMLNSAAFIVGFSIVFITLGAISTEVGQVLVQYKSLLARIAGVIILVRPSSDRHFSDQMACSRTRDCTASKAVTPPGELSSLALPSPLDGHPASARSSPSFWDSPPIKIKSGKVYFFWPFTLPDWPCRSC
jgi:hypothetical protein